MAMEVPVPIATSQDVNDCVGSRRFMVQHVKEKQGQQILAYRQIDHLTESLINPATRTYETLENDNLDLFFNIIRLLLSHRIKFAMFKEDISRAFRRLPIKSQHLKVIVVFFKYQGIIWWAQHLTCPFGAVGSVTAWHRISSFLKRVMLFDTKSII